MPAKDRYHDTVKRALVKDGWSIADEQFTLTVGRRNLWVDLFVQKDEPQFVVLVEVKELAEVDTEIEALANAIGKFLLYSAALRLERQEIPLFIAVSRASFAGILSETLGRHMIEELQIPLIVFDAEQEEIVEWIP